MIELRRPSELNSDSHVELKQVPAGFGPVLTRQDSNNAVRWKTGERLDHLLEETCVRFGANDAVVVNDTVLTYRDLDRRANQLTHYLVEQGVKSGDRVGLLFDKSPETYVAMLAAMKAGATYVPLDNAFPPERIRFIVRDAQIKVIVSMSDCASRLAGLEVRNVLLDSARHEIDAKSVDRLPIDVAPAPDQACYIIYTSGTTGNPKGVSVAHASICNFVRVASELYGYVPGDRVYQGMTIAFDFSIEEVWVPLMAGATLVPGKPGMTLIGEELAIFLRERGVTCLACCPTMLATIEQDLPQLRLLLVGGEACPQSLVARWYRPGRTILNSYGPTEATVTATLTELRPDKPVTIGVPLPTYSIVILDPVEDKVVVPGDLGEIGIAGIGLAIGYVNREDLTKQKFIRDFLQIENNPSGRIYRTGDFGRIDANGEIEYRGRIDTQVKIRGYRIELNEIEAVLLDQPQIAQAAVTTFEPQLGVTELVAYYALKQGATWSRSDIARALGNKLPGYMVPSYLEELSVIPMTVSNKADHKRLPKPNRLGIKDDCRDYVPPRTENERFLTKALVDVLQVKRVSIDHHFFDDLGANSLLMARFCADIRKNPRVAKVSMRDIYINPTIAHLAAHLESSIEGFIGTKREPFYVPSNLSYYTCGAMQLAFYAAYVLFGLWVLDTGYTWAINSGSSLEMYGRAVVFAAGSFVALTGISIITKWVLIGRYEAQSIPIWSLAYFRFWVVMTMMRTTPVMAFTGTPIYSLYLRLMGARIGRNVVMSCRHGPVCPDLLSIGDHTILRKDSIVLGYRAQSNFIHIGPVEIGSNVFVGEGSVIDIDTSIGDNAQLGHVSSLQSGQRIPAGKRYHGSPAVETSSNYCPIENRELGPLRSLLYASVELAGLFLVAVPAPIVAYHFWDQYAAAAGIGLNLGVSALSLLAISAGVFLSAMAIALCAIYVIPRLCMVFLKPGVTYPVFGFHYLLQRIILHTSNSQFFCVLFGDSSFIVRYMRYVGWNLNKVEQTGSNMGTNQRHDNPLLCNIGSRTMVSDGLSMINTQMSATSFQVAESKIGDNNYLGNDIYYPPNGRTGGNCLLGTKTMIPVDGPVRENVGLLGSPPFEIPRMVHRDREMNASISSETRRIRLRQKNIHNAVTAMLFLASRWMSLFAVVALWHVALLNYASFGVFALFAATVAIASAHIAFFVLVERASLGFRRLKPETASIYDPYFWFHERHWKLSESPVPGLFSGTPFRTVLLRAMGMKVGRKVFNCSRSITERTLTTVGDYANLNEGCVLQAHSLEEGVFKSDHIQLGSGCSVGPGAFIHYGVQMGDHVVLDADSFLMKGEILDAHTGWRGNPAKMRACMMPSNVDAPVPEDPKLETRIAAE